MNYQRIYDEIISNAKSRGLNKKLLDGYFERHHIVPRCMNGTNDKSNLVLLTAREHYLCHYLLWKIHKDNQSLFYAYHLMVYKKNSLQERNFKLSSKQYELLRITNNALLSIRSKCKICSNETKLKISNANKGRIVTDEQRLTMSQSQLGRTLTDDHKTKLRNAKLGKASPRKGAKLTEETKDILRKVNIGKKYSEETKQKHRNVMFGFKHTEETKAEMRKPKTEETKLKMKHAALLREERKRNLRKLDLQN